MDGATLICKIFSTKHVMRWHLVFKEYEPQFQYIKGGENKVADALSRLTMSTDTSIDITTDAYYMAELFGQDSTNSNHLLDDEYPLNYDTLQE